MQIYKDECLYTFDNQESPYGVDVCLNCFIGTSPDPAHDFTSHHFETSGHSAYLNLKKVPKPKDEATETKESVEHQPKKLAIHEEDPRDQFEILSKFKTFANDKEADFATVIDKVLTTDSENYTQQLEEWELDLNPCEHVAIFESLFDSSNAQPEAGKALSSHCSECELDKNLWLCLTCGNLGCGRRQFDGSGGNGHALRHFEETQHSLAAKLGSITPEGHVDVFCYSCNDDVKDPNIREHLSRWGVDIAKSVKTEKSMTELQLEQNMKWDFSAGDGSELVTGQGFTGMKNLGNSCYMNSVLQSLFGIPEFAAQFEANKPGDSLNENPQDLRTQLNKLKDGLQSGRYDVISPTMFKQLVGKGHGEFGTARQQDAFEYLSYLLTKIAEHVDSRLPSGIFGFQTERRIACVNCPAVRYRDESEESLSIQVPVEETSDGGFRPVDLYELLDVFTREEKLEFVCPECKSTEAVSSIKFKTFPKVLIVNVQRFRLVNWVPQKVDVPVIVPEGELNLDRFMSKGPQADEHVIEDSESTEEPEFVPDQNKLEMLQSMGFDAKLATAGLKLAKDQGYGDNDFDAAIELIVNGDAEKEAARVSQSGPQVDENALSMLVSMGYTNDQASAALSENKSDVEAAVEWLINGNYDAYSVKKLQDSEKLQAPLGDPSLPANYELNSIICHKGSSVHVGHYVAARTEKNELYLFNDEKISRGADSDELRKFAYIYMFRRI